MTTDPTSPSALDKARDEHQRAERAEEARARDLAKATKQSQTFVSAVDGCEVTVTPAGHVFYNATEWF